jgi:four helix bundle protein
MLIGLRKAWAGSVMREEPMPYKSESSNSQGALLFHHEGLTVYQVALAFMEWFSDRAGADSLSERAFRQIDEAGTRMVLNIAEGNGRYAELDHRRFIQIAESGAVKAAVYVDLCTKAGLWKETEATIGKKHLDQIGRLLTGF